MRNIEYINKVVAEKLGLPIATVAKINNNYWTTFKKQMKKLDTHKFYIKHIGTWEVSRYKLEKYIKNCREWIYNFRHSLKYTPGKQEAIITDYKANYLKCMKMRRIVNDYISERNRIRYENKNRIKADSKDSE